MGIVRLIVLQVVAGPAICGMMLFTGAREVVAEALPLPELAVPPFQPFSESVVPERIQRLNETLDRLSARLQENADPQGWMSYFGIDELRRQISRVDEIHPRDLSRYVPRFFAANPRCEWPETLAVRGSLLALITALETASIPDLESEYEERAARLRELTRVHAANPASATAIEIGRQIHWLRLSRQGRELVLGVRTAWAQPNFLAEIDVDTLAPRELDDLVTDRSPVVDNILGTEIRGQAETTGKVSMRLVPSEDSGLFELELRGNTTARTTGVNGPAHIQTTSQSVFTAVTRVRVTPEGLIAESPQARATTRSNMHDLQVPRRVLSGFGDGRSHIIERFARKKAEELQPQADAIAARRSEERYEKSMAEYVAQSLEKTNQPFREKFRGPLLRIGAIYESLRFSTTADAVQARMLFADGVELGADTVPPTFEHPHSLAFRIHESFLRNAGHMLLRGVTLTDRTMAKFLKGAMGEIPRESREFRLGSHLEPWSITVADEHPIIADLDAAGSTIGVRIQRVTIGDRATPVDLLVLAKYRIERTPHGPCLTRIGNVQVVTDPNQVVQPSAEIINFLSLKASNFFIPEIWFDGLVPPAGGPFDKYAQLGFRELIVENGWLALGFDQTRVKSGDQTATKASTQLRPR